MRPKAAGPPRASRRRSSRSSRSASRCRATSCRWPELPVDLRPLVAPAHTAVVTQECQKGVLGPRAVFPQLADAARAEMIPNAARIVKEARSRLVPVVHCIAAHPPGLVGYNSNARIFTAARKSGVSLEMGTEATHVIDEIGVEEGDLMSVRMHGI